MKFENHWPGRQNKNPFTHAVSPLGPGPEGSILQWDQLTRRTWCKETISYSSGANVMPIRQRPPQLVTRVAGVVPEADTTPKGTGSKQQFFFFFFSKLVVIVELCHSQNSYVNVLTPKAPQCDLICKTGLLQMWLVKIRSYRSRMGPWSKMTAVLVKRGILTQR